MFSFLDKKDEGIFSKIAREAKSLLGLQLDDNVSSSHSTENDVARVKYGLSQLNYYKEPKNLGMSTIPDSQMFDSVKKYQKDKGLHVDGLLKPKGETINSINKDLRKKEQSVSPLLQKTSSWASKVSNFLNATPPARVGEFIADSQIAYEHLKDMKKTNEKLINKYGRDRGAASGTDDYYHPLLQCNLAKISPESKSMGLLLGYGKEAFDYAKKSLQGMPQKNIIDDSRKDLKNNAYGSRLGSDNPNKSCRSLLNDKRPENMRKSNLW